MLKRTLVTGLIVLLFAVPLASAQQDVTPAEIQLSNSPGQSDPEEGIERGESTFAFVFVNYCYTGPGLNPTEESIKATVELVDYPDWLEIAPPGDELEYTPPQYVTDEDCAKVGESIQLNWRIADNAPWGEQGTLNYNVVVTETGDPGTYVSVAGSYPDSMIVAVSEEPVDPVTGLPPGQEEDDDGDGSGPVTTDPEESPAAAPLFILMALVGVAALRRRD